MVVNNKEKLFHIGISPSDGAPLALICGDPGRVCHIAALCEEPSPLASNREYTSYSAKIDGKRIIIMSHGIGGPSTAICVEELYMAGVRTIIRIGTCGGMNKNVRAEDIVIASSAIRAEGTSREYLPVEFPAAADFEVTDALRRAAGTLGLVSHTGIVHCKDSFYGQHSPERMPIADELKNKWRAYIAGGALASEMETAALFCVSSCLGIRAGAVLRSLWNQEIAAAGLPMDGSNPKDELSAAKVAVMAARTLL